MSKTPQEVTSPLAPTSVLVFFLSVLGAINFADRAVIGLAGPVIIAEMHLSASQWGLVGSSFFLLFSLSSLIVPAWSDWVGTRKIMAGLAVIWSLVQLATLVIASFLPLLISRIILGAGEGPYYGTSTTAVSSQTMPAQRGFIFALITLGPALGPALLSPLLAFSLVAFNWRATFALLGVIGIIWVLAWIAVTRENQPERTVQEMLPWKMLFSLLRAPGVIFPILASFACYWYIALLISWVPVYYVQVWHLSQSSAWYVLGVSLPWLMGGLLQVGIGWVSDRLFKKGGSRLRVRVLSIALLIGALLLAGGALAPWLWLSILCLSFTPLGAAFPLTIAELSDRTPTSYRGAFLGLAVAIASLAGLIAPAVTGLLIQHAASALVGFQLAYLVATVFIACCSGLCWVFVRPQESSS
ncbi:MAG TPA: MFS transporter [Ktedonobacteraceae bacterium]